LESPSTRFALTYTLYMQIINAHGALRKRDGP
jgi:hypothetical protein